VQCIKARQPPQQVLMVSVTPEQPNKQRFQQCLAEQHDRIKPQACTYLVGAYAQIVRSNVETQLAFQGLYKWHGHVMSLLRKMRENRAI
jgi:hypothetical protein